MYIHVYLYLYVYVYANVYVYVHVCIYVYVYVYVYVCIYIYLILFQSPYRDELTESFGSKFGSLRFELAGKHSMNPYNSSLLRNSSLCN